MATTISPISSLVHIRATNLAHRPGESRGFVDTNNLACAESHPHTASRDWTQRIDEAWLTGLPLYDNTMIINCVCELKSTSYLDREPWPPERPGFDCHAVTSMSLCWRSLETWDITYGKVLL